MTDTDRFELFSYWRTSATYRVRVAFNLKGVQPRETNVDIDAGEQLGEAFRRINPLGAIPALIDHGAGQPRLPLTQSLAILEFIDETYPAPPLLPAAKLLVPSSGSTHHRPGASLCNMRRWVFSSISSPSMG